MIRVVLLADGDFEQEHEFATESDAANFIKGFDTASDLLGGNGKIEVVLLSQDRQKLIDEYGEMIERFLEPAS